MSSPSWLAAGLVTLVALRPIWHFASLHQFYEADHPEKAVNRGGGWYLFDAALAGAEHVDHIAWDEEHGGHGHQPADGLAPQRVDVRPQTERGHLNGAEGEDPLGSTVVALSTCLHGQCAEMQCTTSTQRV